MWDNAFTLRKDRPKSTDIDNPDVVYVVPAELRDDFPDILRLEVWNGVGDIRHVWELKGVKFITVTFPRYPTKYIYVATQGDLTRAFDNWSLNSPV